jgi:hypothetical protein
MAGTLSLGAEHDTLNRLAEFLNSLV